jgi:SAM-dependent methyltransferase
MFGRRGSAADPDRFAELMVVEACPRASMWDPAWIWSHHMGPTNLWLAELLVERMDLRPGMRVLDMGCGAAATSMFLATEYDVEVVAADLWIDPSDNFARIMEAGLEDRVLPLRVEADSLPFADGWFDASISIDAYHYFGMQPEFLDRYAALVKPGGEIGVVVPGDLDDSGTWETFRSASWWRALWERSGVVDVSVADEIPGGRELWLRFLEASAAWSGSGDVHAEPDAELLFSEQGGSLGFTRIIATRRD